MKRRMLVLLSILAPLLSGAREVAVPAAPPSAFSDTESVTNAPIAASALAKARVFSGALALPATPSNMVEVAFGTAAGGVLRPGEESFSVGWECGAWFFDSPTNRVSSAPLDGSATRSLSFTLRVAEDGKPRSLTLSATGADGAFDALVAAPPEWMFSRDWNVVRLTIRGVNERDERVSVRFDTDPGVLILR